MKIQKKIIKRMKGKQTIGKDIKICVECGSKSLKVTEQDITCRDCGKTKYFKKELIDFKFKQGDKVQIVELGKTCSPIYSIFKIKQSSDGTIRYILKSKSSPVTLFYQESKESHLQLA